MTAQPAALASGECVDVTDKPMLERFFAGLGAFDHLAVTVGDALLNKQIMELTDEEARSAFEVRFWGQYNAVRAADPHINKTGSITLVSGLAGQRASPRRSIYAGSSALSEISALLPVVLPAN
jgi:NAD(P)-dependent dehydrogenase (short-subunit alcohol dehydrogenase family)